MSKEKRQIGFGDWYPAPNLDKYIAEINKTRRLTYGPFSEKFEKEFAQINGCKYMIFCSSGTAALYASLLTLRNLYPDLARRRKYVVLPATTFISDFNITILNGFIPLFVDVGSDYNIDYKQLEQTITKYARDIFAVMPSSLMGRPADGLRIRNMINSYDKNIFMILDSCENVASKYNDQYPESYADFTAWSFYLSHLLICGSAGGMIGTNDEQLAIKVRSTVNHGRSPEYISIDSDNNVDEATLRDITAKRFKFVQLGLNFRLGDVEAAYGLSMLEDDFMGQLEKRRKNAEYLIKHLSQFEELCLPRWTEKEQMRHMMLPIRLYRGDATDIINFLESKGIETRKILPMWNPITESYFGDVTQFMANFPISYEVYQKGWYIGTHQYLTQDDLDYIVKTFKEYFNK